MTVLPHYCKDFTNTPQPRYNTVGGSQTTNRVTELQIRNFGELGNTH